MVRGLGNLTDGDGAVFVEPEKVKVLKRGT